MNVRKKLDLWSKNFLQINYRSRFKEYIYLHSYMSKHINKFFRLKKKSNSVIANMYYINHSKKVLIINLSCRLCERRLKKRKKKKERDFL